MTNQSVQLKIVLPHKVLPIKTVARVVVPAVKGNLTVIPDRAPTTLALTNGILNVLSETGESQDKYFIKGGVANIAADECIVMTEKALNFNDVTPQKVSELKEEHSHELKDLGLSTDTKDSETEFYDYISHYLSLGK